MNTNPAWTLVSDVIGPPFGRPKKRIMSFWRGPIWLVMAVASTASLLAASQPTGPAGAPPILRRQPQSQVAVVGENARLTVDVWSTTRVNYQWFFNGTAMDGETLRYLDLYEVDSSDNGRYSVAVTNASGGLMSEQAVFWVALAPVLVPFGALWRYKDDGTEPEPGWQLTSFDDYEWYRGAPDFGVTISNQVITSYFRRRFDYNPKQLGAMASLPTRLLLEVMRDDGVIVYLNGMEVVRDNMPGGAVTSQTPALRRIMDSEEDQVLYFHIDAKELRLGTNVVAVEIHQASLDSCDVGFDLELLPELPDSPGALTSAYTNFSSLDAAVHTVVAEPDGKLLIGGDFTMVGQVPRGHFARLDLDGNLDADFGSGGGADGPVYAAARLDDGSVVIGGLFGAVHGQPRPGFAFLEGTTGAVLPQAPALSGSIHALQAAEGVVYAAGAFTCSIDGLARSNLVAVDAATGNLRRDWSPTVDGPVHGLWLWGDILFVAGSFTMAEGQYRYGLAALDRFTGQVHGWNPDPTGPVQALCVAGNTIYIGGDFSRIAGQSRTRFAAVSWPGGEMLEDWRHEVDGPIHSLALWDNLVYLGGEFARIDGQTPRNLSGVQAGVQAPIQVKVNGPVFATTLDQQGGLVIGGDFSQVNGEPRARIARLHGVNSPPPAAPQLTLRQTKTPDPHLRITGPPGRTYALEMTTTLPGGWQRLITDSAPNGVLDYTHRESDNYRVRIYRALVF